MNENELFSTDGRIDGTTYFSKWARIKIPYWIIQIVLLGITALTFGIAAILTIPLMVLIWAIHVALLLPLMAKRFHDMNLSGWFSLLVFLAWALPLVYNVVFFLVLVLADGTVGPNQYGADPKGRIAYYIG